MNPPLTSSIFPPNFPQELVATAFINGSEAAWQQNDCLSAISWFAENGFAILGSELWLVRDNSISTAIKTKAGPAMYVTDCNRTKDELWEDYVQRSAREATRAVGEFRWPEGALEPPRAVYFNLCWADQAWVSTYGKNANHTFDE